MSLNPWIAVAFDRCLVEITPAGTLGEPVVEMIDRVRAWIVKGRSVRVLTHRVARGRDDWLEQDGLVSAWVEQHVGVKLPVQAEIGADMIALWGPDCVAVEPNTGRELSTLAQQYSSPLAGWLHRTSLDIEQRDPEGELTRGIVVMGMPGHTEVHLEGSLLADEALAHGMLHTAHAVVAEMFDPEQQVRGGPLEMRVVDVPLTTG